MNVTWTLDLVVKGGPVHDADSFHVVGLFIWSEVISVPGYENVGPFELELPIREMTRLAHCNAAEMSTPTGRAAQASVVAWFGRFCPGPVPIPLVPLGRDKYKRLLCDVILSDGSKLSDFVLSLPGSVPMSLHEQMRML